MARSQRVEPAVWHLFSPTLAYFSVYVREQGQLCGTGQNIRRRECLELCNMLENFASLCGIPSRKNNLARSILIGSGREFWQSKCMHHYWSCEQYQDAEEVCSSRPSNFLQGSCSSRDCPVKDLNQRDPQALGSRSRTWPAN